MALDNSDLQVSLTDTFDTWRGRYNILTERSSQHNAVGEISFLDPAIPTAYRDSLVAAINYVYSIRASEGQPLTQSLFTNCDVADQLNFGTAWIKREDSAYGSNITFGEGDDSSVWFTANGRIGVGTNDPANALHVAGTAEIQDLYVKNPSTGRSLSMSNITSGTTNYCVITANAPIVINQGGMSTLLNQGGGKFGVGYANESELIEGFNFKRSSSRAGLRLESLNHNNTIGVDATGFEIVRDGVRQLKLLDNGFLGIGVDIPEYQLEVDGRTQSTDLGFGSKLYAGSVEFAEISPIGQTLIKLTAAGTIKHGSTTILGSDGKIDFSNIKNASTTGVAEGTNLYFTDARARTAIGTGAVSTVSITNLLKLPKYATANLPVGVSGDVAYSTDINLPVVHNGAAWVRFDGTAI